MAASIRAVFGGVIAATTAQHSTVDCRSCYAGSHLPPHPCMWVTNSAHWSPAKTHTHPHANRTVCAAWSRRTTMLETHALLERLSRQRDATFHGGCTASAHHQSWPSSRSCCSQIIAPLPDLWREEHHHICRTSTYSPNTLTWSLNNNTVHSSQ